MKEEKNAFAQIAEAINLYPVLMASKEIEGVGTLVIEEAGGYGLTPSVERLKLLIAAAKNTIKYLNKYYDGNEDVINNYKVRKFEERYFAKSSSRVNKPARTKIYLMKSHLTGFVKIGKSKNPSARESTLQSEDPMLEMIFQSDWIDGRKERDFHIMYSHLRVRGEWFNLSQDDIDSIKASFQK